jgi:hypothetical protein
MMLVDLFDGFMNREAEMLIQFRTYQAEGLWYRAMTSTCNVRSPAERSYRAEKGTKMKECEEAVLSKFDPRCPR